jgi:hypothetical protein
MFRLGVVVVLVFCAVFAGVNVVRAETLKFFVLEDTWVSEANPTQNYGNGTYLSVKDRSGAGESYLKLSDESLSTLKGLNIEEASLWLYQYQATYSPGDTLYAHIAASGWSENALSWDTRAGFEQQAVSSLELNSGNDCWRAFTGLAPAVNQWLTQNNHGLVLENALDGKKDEFLGRFYSSEWTEADKRPYFMVEASVPALPQPKAAPEPLSALLFLAGGSVLLVNKRKIRSF